jgi:hypothetical protein
MQAGGLGASSSSRSGATVSLGAGLPASASATLDIPSVTPQQVAVHPQEVMVTEVEHPDLQVGAIPSSGERPDSDAAVRTVPPSQPTLYLLT